AGKRAERVAVERGQKRSIPCRGLGSAGAEIQRLPHRRKNVCSELCRVGRIAAGALGDSAGTDRRTIDPVSCSLLAEKWVGLEQKGRCGCGNNAECETARPCQNGPREIRWRHHPRLDRMRAPERTGDRMSRDGTET